MRGVNKVILVGNLGADPEVRYMPSGGAVANVSIATSESWRDKQTGEMKDQTEWHRVVFFNRLGEIVGEYLKKGSKVYVEGQLRTRKWQGQDGQDRWTTEIIAREMQMLDSRGGGTANFDQGGGGFGGGSGGGAGGGPGGGQRGGPPQGGQNDQRGQRAGGGNQGGQYPGGAPQGGGNAPQQQTPPQDDFDDDIPF